MRILVACEQSQAVCMELRRLGLEAYSRDILECAGPAPHWHIQGDVIQVMLWADESGVPGSYWGAIIAFPPCTDLAVSGAKHFEKKRANGSQQKSIQFFRLFTDHPCIFKAIENPISIMSTLYRKPDQIIQPYMFGDPFTKTTCLWLYGLPLLQPTDLVDKGERHVTKSGKSLPKWYSDAIKLSPAERAKVRSKTFPGIAKAMAEQWAPIFKMFG